MVGGVPHSPSLPASTPNVLFYSHHSTGLGHLVRSLAVAGGLASRARVTLCCGGRVPDGIAIPPGVDLVALPPLGADADGRLADATGATSVSEVLAERGALLERCFERLAPEVLMIELFPFGRRKFAPELLPLLDAARSAQPGPLVVCSVRDLLVSGHPEKASHDEEAARRLDAYFDAVIVHGDPRFARLEETFAPATPTRVPIFYSGFAVSGSRPAIPTSRRPEVVVSAGGGLVGRDLFEAAAEAHLSHLRDFGLRTRIITGPFLPDPDVDRLRSLAGTDTGLSVERFVADLRSQLAQAAVSVSQCGYNTTLDILLTGVPALVVPYGDDRENEQSERARRLAALGAVEVVPPGRLNARTLADGVLGLLAAPATPPALDLAGAERSAEVVFSLLDSRLVSAR